MTKGAPEERRRWRIQRSPYPFFYTRDPFDPRKFNPMGETPIGYKLSRWGVRFTVAFLVLLLGGSLLLLLVQLAQSIFH